MSFQWHAFLTAIQFLTRIPVPGGMSQAGADPNLLKASVVYFPLIGALIGLFTGLVIFGCSYYWTMPIAVVLGLIVEALLTGAFHEDAVADCCDAFGGGWKAEDILRIMKDSRVGSFGALGLFLFVGLRAMLLMSLPTHLIIPACILCGSIGRWSIHVLMALIPPIPKREGLSKDVGEQMGWKIVLIGFLFTLPASVIGLLNWPIQLMCVYPMIVLQSWIWGRYVKWRIEGITGDCLGMGCYQAQLITLMIVSIK